MPNYQPFEISDAIVAIIESAAGQGKVLDDRRFNDDGKDLALLVKSQADIDDWRGWIVVWTGIPLQEDDTPDYCFINTTYAFALMFFHFYEDDYQPDLTTNLSFKSAIFAANEALNNSKNLGLTETFVNHAGLQSEGDFITAEIGGGTVNQRYHFAAFTLSVLVQNHY